MNYFQAENLSKSYGPKLLFDNITFGIDLGQKAGLIARNGAGKTTLLNIITGKDIADQGQYTFRKDIRIAYLEQNPVFAPGHSVSQTLLNQDNPIAQTIRRYEELLILTSEQPQGPYADELQKIIARMDELHAWDHEVKIKQILTQLKITSLTQPIDQLSGGQIKRVALAKILIEEADFIIMDEPTNHLDLEMIEWLEDYLARQKLTLLLVTHDRYFLDKVCNEILELDRGNIYKYKGNYAYFLEKKEERENAMLAETERARNLLRKETQWMRRQPQARTTKSKARIDSYYELKEKARMQTESRPNEIKMEMARMGKKILELENISKSYDEKVLLRDFSYIFKRGEKAGIVGMNGSGKTTLLNIITQRIKPDSGKVTTGETIQYGYYSQEGMIVDESKKVVEVIKDIAESIRINRDTSMSAEQFLQYFNFPYNVQHDYVYKLSGGEKRRLFLVTVLMKNPNFLILDEPTNDLDIATLNVLEDFLEQFSGCLIVVSHDRYFLDNLVDHVFVFEGEGKIKDFPGNYTEYRMKKAEQEVLEKKTEKKESPAKPPSSEKKKLTYKEQKEFDSLESEIAKLEQEKSGLLESMNSGNLSAEELVQTSETYERCSQLLEEKELRWLELSQWI